MQMMLFRYWYLLVEEMPRFNARKMENYCKNILEVLENNTECERIFARNSGIYCIKDGELDIMNRKCFERKETTEYLKNQIDEIKSL